MLPCAACTIKEEGRREGRERPELNVVGLRAVVESVVVAGEKESERSKREARGSLREREEVS